MSLFHFGFPAFAAFKRVLLFLYPLIRFRITICIAKGCIILQLQLQAQAMTASYFTLSCNMLVMDTRDGILSREFIPGLTNGYVDMMIWKRINEIVTLFETFSFVLALNIGIKASSWLYYFLMYAAVYRFFYRALIAPFEFVTSY
jgi:hypothetical protein